MLTSCTRSAPQGLRNLRCGKLKSDLGLCISCMIRIRLSVRAHVSLINYHLNLVHFTPTPADAKLHYMYNGCTCTPSLQLLADIGKTLLVPRQNVCLFTVT